MFWYSGFARFLSMGLEISFCWNIRSFFRVAFFISSLFLFFIIIFGHGKLYPEIKENFKARDFHSQIYKRFFQGVFFLFFFLSLGLKAPFPKKKSPIFPKCKKSFFLKRYKKIFQKRFHFFFNFWSLSLKSAPGTWMIAAPVSVTEYA